MGIASVASSATNNRGAGGETFSDKYVELKILKLSKHAALRIKILEFSLVFDIIELGIYIDMKDNRQILARIEKLICMHQQGKLGGDIMPEDANPHLAKSSKENYLYFTLPMALNYQRNSYKLWESANRSYHDQQTNFIFDPQVCLNKTFYEVQSALVKYKVALQKQKQTEIWLRLCQTFVELYDGDIRKLFTDSDNDVNEIRDFIQKEHKKEFPYLSGAKICNYWLYVIYQYTDQHYKNLGDLTIAPDTHVIQATHRLGIIDTDELSKSNIQSIVVARWSEILKDTKYSPIDIHTPLWLWSRSGFQEIQ